MSRRVEDREHHIAKIVSLPILDVEVWEFDGRRLVEEHRGTGRVGQTASAGQVISLDVGLEDVRDPHGLLSGGFEVGLDVKLWIHHSAGGCTPSAKQVAGTAVFGTRNWRKIVSGPPCRDGVQSQR